MKRRTMTIVSMGLGAVLCFPIGALAVDGSGDTQAPGFGIGPRVGFYDARDGDEGTFTGGLQARMRVLPFLGIEGSVDYHQAKFANGTVEVRTYPVMVSALLYFFSNPAISPYVLAGVGWHFQDVEFQTGTERSSQFGGQAGAGFDIPLGPRATFDADFRYIFLDFDDSVDARAGEALSADSLAGTLGLTFYF